MSLNLLESVVLGNSSVVLIPDLLPVAEGVIEILQDLVGPEVLQFIINHSLETCGLAYLPQTVSQYTEAFVHHVEGLLDSLSLIAKLVVGIHQIILFNQKLIVVINIILSALSVVIYFGLVLVNLCIQS